MDLEIVKNLPTLGASGSKPSKIIEKLVLSRENRHNECMGRLKAEYRKINFEVEEKIRFEAEILKTSLNRIRKHVQKVIGDEVIVEEKTLISLTEEGINEIQDSIIEKNDERLSLISKFHKSLVSIEKYRSEKFKQTLKTTYKDVDRIHHKLPYETDKLFELEILNLNEITLNNYNCYLFLQNDLKLQVEEDTRRWQLEIMELKDRYNIALKKQKIRNLVDTKETAFSKSLEVNREPSPSDIEGLVVRDDSTKIVEDLGAWSEKTQETLSSLDAAARELVDLYKKAVGNVFDRFFEELQAVTEAAATESEADVHDIEYIHAEVYQPILDDISQQYACEVSELKNLWNSITEYMRSNVKHTYTFLQNSVHLWDSHFDRVNEIQAAVLHDLKNTIDKNDLASQSYEKKINSAVDKLRQESTSVNLGKHLEIVNKSLDSVSKMFHSHCSAEIKILEKYPKFINKEIDLLLAEIERFLGENAQEDSMMDPKMQRKRASQLSLQEDNDHLLPYEMKWCRFQVDAVNNWMFGLWEAIKIYMSSCRKELLEQANEWLEKHSDKLRKRLETKMNVHKSRYMRTKIMIHDIREEEVNCHLNNLKHLEEIIDKQIAKAKNYNEICRNKQQFLLEDYIGRELEKRKSSFTVKAAVDNFETLTAHYRRNLEDIAFDNETSINATMNGLKKAIKDFTNTVKPFYADGRYHFQEVKVLNKKILALNNSLPKKFAGIFTEAQSSKENVLEKLNEYHKNTISKLLLSKETHEFKEKVILNIENLQQNIRREVYRTKYRFKKTEASTQGFVFLCKLNLEKFRDFKSIRNSWMETVLNIFNVVNYLLNGDGILLDSGSFILDVMPIAEDDAFPDNYITKMTNYIDETIKIIEDLAKEFYRSHEPGEEVQSTYQAFMKDVMDIFAEYKFQIDISWMHFVQELIGCAMGLLKFCDEFHTAMMTKQLMEDKYNFETIANDEIENLQQLINEVNAKYSAVLKKQFRKEKTKDSFVKSLEENSNSVQGNHENVIRSNAKEISEKLYSKYQSIKKQTSDLHEELKNMDEDRFLQILTHKLMKHFEGRLSLLEKMEDNIVRKSNLKPLFVSEGKDKQEDLSEMEIGSTSSTISKISAFRQFLEHLRQNGNEDSKEDPLLTFIKDMLVTIYQTYQIAVSEINKSVGNIKVVHEDFVRVLHEEIL